MGRPATGLVLLALLPAAFAANRPSTLRPWSGDLDGDGRITPADVGLALRAVVYPKSASAFLLRAADVTRDGRVDVVDVILLLRVTLGLELPPAPDLPQRFVDPVDGAELVRVPEGPFMMGTTPENRDALAALWPKTFPSGIWANTGRWPGWETPAHTVDLDDYYVMRDPVTNRQYARFEAVTGYRADGRWRLFAGPGREESPVTEVTWGDSQAYARWAGRALLTEAQFEKAARGPDARLWPWGSQWDPSLLNVREGGPGRPSPGGAYPADLSPYGVRDMAGNVWEWCADWFGERYYAKSPPRNPAGPATGVWRVIRGGSWYDDGPFTRTTTRSGNSPMAASYCVGFRCGMSPAP